MEPRLTPYSSVQDVQVTSRDGATGRYDLFRARRLGERTQDPILKPGDTVTVFPYQRQVRVSGKVRRPGTYQLLPGEQLQRLLTFYADGTSQLADLSRVRLERFHLETLAETSYLDLRPSGAVASVDLGDLDVVIVPSRNDLLPVVSFEGAFLAPVDEQAAAAAENPRRQERITQQFKPGETLYTSLQRITARISPDGDLAAAYLTREGVADPVPIDLARLLYQYDPRMDIELRPFDRVVIPFGRFEVLVTGEVTESRWPAGWLVRAPQRRGGAPGHPLLVASRCRGTLTGRCHQSLRPLPRPPLR